MSKTNPGNFFEDFRLGQVIRHATPRTVTVGDQSLYTALYGSRFVVQSSDAFARMVGYPMAPVDDLLLFHVVFGKTVPDISLNAVANLGYADCRFLRAAYPGDTLSTVSEVIGLKENSNGKTGTVYVRSTGRNQRGEEVLTYVRWVMVRKRDEAAPAPVAHVPDLPASVAVEHLGQACPPLTGKSWDFDLSGSPHRFADYAVGEKIDHVDGMTVEEAEHQLATRLYQNTAKVHFNQFSESQGRFGRRLIYGGHVISLARALVLQRPGECLSHCGHQWRPARGPALCRWHGLCVVRNPGQGRLAGPRRCRSAAHHDPGHPRSSLRGVPHGRGIARAAPRHSRARLLGPDPGLKHAVTCPRACAKSLLHMRNALAPAECPL